MELPASLRNWFYADAAVTLALALALGLVPEALLGRLGWTCVDPVTSRLLGAALLAMGVQGLPRRAPTLEGTLALLRLKLVWAGAAALVLFSTVGGGAPSAAWAALAYFIATAGVWLHYLIRYRQMSGAERLDETTPDEHREE